MLGGGLSLGGGASTPGGLKAMSPNTTAALFGSLDSASAAALFGNLQQPTLSGASCGSGVGPQQHSAAYHLFDPSNLNENIYNLSQFNVSYFLLKKK